MLVVTAIGVSASGAGYPPTIPCERETEPDHPDPEDEMQEVVGSVHGHEVGRRFLADDEPVHEQHQVDRATKHQVGAGLRCGARHSQAGDPEQQVHDVVQDRDLEQAEQPGVGMVAGE